MRVLDRQTFAAQAARWDRRLGISLDLETNGRPPWEPGGRIAGVALAGWEEQTASLPGIYIPLAHQVGPNADPLVLSDVLAFLDGLGVRAFYSATEVMWALARWNLRLSVIGDAYIAARLLSLPDLSLKDLADTHLGGHALQLRELLPADADFTTLDTDDPRVLAYTLQDVQHNWRIEDALLPRLRELRLQPVYQLELHAAALMAQHTLYGYGLDAEALTASVAVEQEAQYVLAGEIHDVLGNVNMNSPTQLGDALHKRLGIVSPLTTPTGRPSWSQDALEALRGADPVISQILHWKSGAKTLSTLSKYLDAPEADGRLHPRWQAIGIHGSARMYAEHPALQSLPTFARRALPAPPGCRWMEVVWDRPELRCLAVLAEDTQLAACLDAPDFAGALSAATGIDFESPEVALYDYVYSGDSTYLTFQRAFPALAEFLTRTIERAQTSGMITSWLNRQWRLQPCDTPDAMARRACRAVAQQSVGTALKVSLSMLDMSQRHGAPLLHGVWQVLPLFDRVAYVIPEDTPLSEHCEIVARAFALNLGGHVPVSMVCGFRTGPSLGTLTEIEVT